MATPLHPGRATALPALLGICLLQSAAAAQQTAPADAAAQQTAPAAPAGAEPQPPGAADDPAGAEPLPAAETPAIDPLFSPRRTTRRGGFAAGISGGLALGSAAGYPNDVQKIGFQRHYTETGVGIGGGGYVWLGGVLADWLTFGAGVGGHALAAADHSILAGGFMFHTEIFPLFSLGERWTDVGVILDAGTGLAYTTADADDDTDAIDGALPARIGGGVFYEGIRLWKVSMGPWLYADYTWSTSVRQPGFYLGWRTALYTEP
ncbi:hypothetical protein [Sorangium cellulosum]|uniref:Secreted protein n=1 Tax=Sorangium cellulosum TaxID=56 RepID=A0A150QGD2_SORCE|nr:hypothetical protein [Sorangium cellulosum]KYF67044.1 hypothetical protein BE15_11795 [Sorangium cellulosum]